MCISPDFVLVHQAVEAELLDALATEVREVFGTTKEDHGVGLSAADAQHCAYGDPNSRPNPTLTPTLALALTLP